MDKIVTSVTEDKSTAQIFAEQIIILLVCDLGYEKTPVHGHVPIRHLISWDMAMRFLGERYGKEYVKKVLEFYKKELELEK